MANPDTKTVPASSMDVAPKTREADDAGVVPVLEDLGEQIEEDRWMLRAWLN
jgi:starvation-inducible DNA-binding protein